MMRLERLTLVSFYLWKFRLGKLIQVFQKILGDIYLLNSFCNRIPKVRTKNFKNYISIFAFVACRNWLDTSLP